MNLLTPVKRTMVDRITGLRAELERERIATTTARHEAAHWRDVAERLHVQLLESRSATQRTADANRTRQMRQRRRRQFAAPLVE